MSFGIWEGGRAVEVLEQSRLTRHRLLQVSVGQNLNLSWNGASSGLASVDPNTIGDVKNNVSDMGFEGGPHFVMSGDTPDQAHTFGFEFALFLNGIASANQAEAGVGGYSVTWWALIANTYSAGQFPVWASFLTKIGVQVRELWHSFDVNATCLRAQITNLAVTPGPSAANLNINIAFAEL